MTLFRATRQKAFRFGGEHLRFCYQMSNASFHLVSHLNSKFPSKSNQIEGGTSGTHIQIDHVICIASDYPSVRICMSSCAVPHPFRRLLHPSIFIHSITDFTHPSLFKLFSNSNKFLIHIHEFKLKHKYCVDITFWQLFSNLSLNDYFYFC